MDNKEELKFRKQQLKESIKLMSLVSANNFIILEKFSKFNNLMKFIVINLNMKNKKSGMII